MLTFISCYLVYGVGVYLGCAAKEIKTLKEADKASILSGLAFGILAFPIALGIVVHDELKK
jgi:uncharacterized membrane protein YkvI